MGWNSWCRTCRKSCCCIFFVLVFSLRFSGQGIGQHTLAGESRGGWSFRRGVGRCLRRFYGRCTEGHMIGHGEEGELLEQNDIIV